MIDDHQKERLEDELDMFYHALQLNKEAASIAIKLHKIAIEDNDEIGVRCSFRSMRDINYRHKVLAAGMLHTLVALRKAQRTNKVATFFGMKSVKEFCPLYPRDAKSVYNELKRIIMKEPKLAHPLLRFVSAKRIKKECLTCHVRNDCCMERCFKNEGEQCFKSGICLRDK